MKNEGAYKKVVNSQKEKIKLFNKLYKSNISFVISSPSSDVSNKTID